MISTGDSDKEDVNDSGDEDEDIHEPKDDSGSEEQNNKSNGPDDDLKNREARKKNCLTYSTPPTPHEGFFSGQYICNVR